MMKLEDLRYNLADCIDNVRRYVLSSCIPENRLALLRDGKAKWRECVWCERGNNWIRFVPKMTIILVYQMFNFLRRNLNQLEICVGRKQKYTILHRQVFDDFDVQLEFWMNHHRLNFDLQQSLDNTGDILIDLTLSFAPLPNKPKNSKPVFSGLSLRRSNRPGSVYHVVSQNSTTPAPPLLQLIPEDAKMFWGEQAWAILFAHSHAVTTVQSGALTASLPPCYDDDVLPSILTELSRKLLEMSNQRAQARANAVFHAPKQLRAEAKSAPSNPLPLESGRGAIWCQYWHDQGRCGFGAKCTFYHPPHLATNKLAGYDLDGCYSQQHLAKDSRQPQSGRMEVSFRSDQNQEKQLRKQHNAELREKQREVEATEAKEMGRLTANALAMREAEKDFEFRFEQRALPSRVAGEKTTEESAKIPPVVVDNKFEMTKSVDDDDDGERSDAPNAAAIEETVDVVDDWSDLEDETEGEGDGATESDIGHHNAGQAMLDDRFTSKHARFSESEVAAVVVLQRKIRYDITQAICCCCCCCC
jgi:hypothetical protein